MQKRPIYVDPPSNVAALIFLFGDAPTPHILARRPAGHGGAGGKFNTVRPTQNGAR